MIVDCMTCPVRGQRCGDCAVTVLRASGLHKQRGAAGFRLVPEFQLDAAESRVVSMFVGAGLVNAGAVARLRARRESVQHSVTVRDVG